MVDSKDLLEVAKKEANREEERSLAEAPQYVVDTGQLKQFFHDQNFEDYTRDLILEQTHPIDLTNPEQLESRAEWYWNKIRKYDLAPSVSGFASALGITRRTLINWATGNVKSDVKKDFAERWFSVLESYYEQSGLKGTTNPLFLIFTMKNHFGYKDKTSIELAGREDKLPKTPEEIREQILKDAKENGTDYDTAIIDENGNLIEQNNQ